MYTETNSHLQIYEDNPVWYQKEVETPLTF